MRTIYVGDDYKCREPFIKFHMRTQRWAILVAHRRSGKTVACVNDLIDAALRCNKDRPQFAYIAPYYGQAKDVAWKYFKQYTKHIPGVKINESSLTITLPGSRQIKLYGADNPDAFRGMYFDGIILDEVADLKPEVWGEVLRPALADREGWCVMIGTPKGQDFFYKTYMNALKEPNEWFSMMLKASDSGLIPEAELQSLRSSLEPAVYEQEFECSFETPNSNQLISMATIDLATNRTHVSSDSAIIMGVDCARFGDDRSVILTRSNKLIDVKVVRQFDTMQLAAAVAEQANIHKPDMIFVDSVGLGAGVYDRLKQLGYKCIEAQASNKASDPERFGNKRIEMWHNAKGWLEDRGSIGGHRYTQELIQDLVAPRYHFDNHNKMMLEKKEDMKKRGIPSPDLGDALAMTFYQPVLSPGAKKLKQEIKKVRGSNRAGGVYDWLR